MSAWLSENLNQREEVFAGPTRLNGYSLASTGREHRFVAFKDGERTATLIVIPPGDEKSLSGLNEPYPNGLSVESLTGDGRLVANVFWEASPVLVGPTEEA